MTVAQLKSSLKTVDWGALVDEFVMHDAVLAAIDFHSTRIARWSKQFELIEKGNPALAFVRATQSASQHATAACALGLYRSAAASIRGIMENGLYFTYFRQHITELSTLARDDGYYVSRADIIAYHKIHTNGFKSLQEKVGFLGRLDRWYGEISAVVHGQIPGTWIDHSSLAEVKHDIGTLSIVLEKFEQGEELLHLLYLLTSGRELWDSFSPGAKKALIAGLPGDIRAALGLDKA